jgi:hypothetical protein
MDCILVVLPLIKLVKVYILQVQYVQLLKMIIKSIFANYVTKYEPIIFPVYHGITNNDELKSLWFTQFYYITNKPLDDNQVAVYLDNEEEGYIAWCGDNAIYTILTDEIICQKERLKTIYNDTIINAKFTIECNYPEPFAPYNFEMNNIIDCIPKYLSELFNLNVEVLKYYKNVQEYNEDKGEICKRKLYITLIFTNINDTTKITYETIVIP